MTKRSPERIDLLRRLAADGATATEIAHALDVSVNTTRLA